MLAAKCSCGPSGRNAVRIPPLDYFFGLAADAGRVRAAADDAVNQFATRGFRSLGVARGGENGEWQFLGVLPLFDPPREDSKATIETASQMGIRVKMVTGDNLAIAL